MKNSLFYRLIVFQAVFWLAGCITPIDGDADDLNTIDWSVFSPERAAEIQAAVDAGRVRLPPGVNPAGIVCFEPIEHAFQRGTFLIGCDEASRLETTLGNVNRFVFSDLSERRASYWVAAKYAPDKAYILGGADDRDLPGSYAPEIVVSPTAKLVAGIFDTDLDSVLSILSMESGKNLIEMTDFEPMNAFLNVCEANARPSYQLALAARREENRRRRGTSLSPVPLPELSFVDDDYTLDFFWISDERAVVTLLYVRDVIDFSDLENSDTFNESDFVFDGVSYDYSGSEEPAFNTHMNLVIRRRMLLLPGEEPRYSFEFVDCLSNDEVAGMSRFAAPTPTEPITRDEARALYDYITGRPLSGPFGEISGVRGAYAVTAD